MNHLRNGSIAVGAPGSPARIAAEAADNVLVPHYVRGLGLRGFVGFKLQRAAERYLRNLPFPYAGQTKKTDYGWGVSYHRTQP